MHINHQTVVFIRPFYYQMSGACVFISLVITLLSFGILWWEDLWLDFYHWGPPFQIGSIVITTWGRWWVLVGLLVLYQASHVYIEETSGREFERKHLAKDPFTDSELFLLCCYNFYKWLGTILHILVAVTRVDIWMAIALVDTVAKACMWYSYKGRRKRPFS
tara:strand:+ start:1638 stop:2123 length:486 start_codon:yes stop_codon:yes gene_type:complete